MGRYPIFIQHQKINILDFYWNVFSGVIHISMGEINFLYMFDLSKVSVEFLGEQNK